MANLALMTTRDIAEIFTEEIAMAGGTVSDSFDDGDRLYLRSILPPEMPVRQGDMLQGGVALMATTLEVHVHPYLFRQVCSNGAIRAHAVQTRRLLVPSLPEQLEDAT